MFLTIYDKYRRSWYRHEVSYVQSGSVFRHVSIIEVGEYTDAFDIFELHTSYPNLENL